MRQTVRVVQVLDLDEDSVELTCNAVSMKKPVFKLDRIIGGDMQHLHEEMAGSLPKVFKIVVSFDFYKKNDVNIRKTVDIEVSP